MIEYSGKKSIYAPNAAPSTSISIATSMGILRSQNGGNDDIAERKAILEGEESV